MSTVKLTHNYSQAGASTTKSVLALLLLVPAPSLGLLAALVWFPETIGRPLFAVCKIWLLLVPAVWTIMVDRDYWRWPRWPRHGTGVGFLSGIVIFVGIVGAYFLLGRHWVDVDHIRTVAASVGLDQPHAYLAAAAYWCVVNSVLEEYVWRWFVYRKCESLMPPAWAVVASAALFTLHHLIALQAYFDLRITVIGGLGVFTGGVIWSACYLKFRSIWPGWISHIWADLAVFGVGYHLFFVLT